MDRLSPQVQFYILQELLRPLSAEEFCIYTQELGAYGFYASALLFPIAIILHFAAATLYTPIYTFVALLLVFTGPHIELPGCLLGLGMLVVALSTFTEVPIFCAFLFLSFCAGNALVKYTD
jgi:hypothetical protein